MNGLEALVIQEQFIVLALFRIKLTQNMNKIYYFFSEKKTNKKSV